MAPTETCKALDARTIIRDFVRQLVHAVAGDEVENFSPKTLCSSPGTKTFDGYQFSFRGILVVIDKDGTRISMQQSYLDKLERLEFVEPEQVQELFRACGEAVRRQSDARIQRRSDAAQRRAHEMALASIALKISGTGKIS